MEDQGKRLLLAVALALGIFLLWQVVFPPEKPTDKPPPAAEVTAPDRQLESPVGRPAEVTPAAPAGEETVIERDYRDLTVELSSRGARLVSWRLKDPKYDREWTRGEMIASREHGAFTVNFHPKLSSIVIPPDAIWTEVPGESPDHIVYRYEVDGLAVEKAFTIHPDDYLLELVVTVDLAASPGGEAPREITQQLAISLVGQQDPKAPTGGGMGRVERVRHAACHINGEVSQLSAKRLHERGPTERGGTIRWAGFNHPYLFFAVAPRTAGSENIACNTYPVRDVPGGMQVDLVYQPAKLRAGEPLGMRREVVAYIGPKHLSALKKADGVAGVSTGFRDAVDMGWFQIIGEPLQWLLLWFWALTGNWAIAIVLLTFVVKLATLYWTHKSMRSMRRMGALAPEMKKLQEKHGSDRARLQQEMMGLYKQHGVNPLSGCLPILLQMPIWIALYRMLSSSGELYLAPFIPGWIDDLTSTDPYYVLPILLMGMMFLQSKLSPATLDSMQQKVLVYGMPLMFGVMGFFFPSGLTLYILTNTTLSMFHTLYIRKTDPIKPPAGAGAPAPAGDKLRDKVERPGKAAKAPAPAVIDAEAEEVDEAAGAEAEGEAAGAEAEGEEAPAKPPARSPGGAPRKTNQPRRKRKRGKQ
jgi:YidC/Oxa1 family membrane protein insertase